MKVYPEKIVVKAVVPMEESLLASRIIEARENGLSKAEAIGVVLAGSDDVVGFNRVWLAVENDRKAMASLNPLDYATASDFASALDSASVFIPVSVWADRLREKYGVETFAELKALLLSNEV